MNDIYSVCFVLSPNFSDLINSCRLVVSEKRMWGVGILKVGENCANFCFNSQFLGL